MFKKVIWLTGMPRSGTTWLSQIFASSPEVRLKFCPLFSYEFKNALDESASKDQIIDFFEKVYTTKGEYLDQLHLKRDGLIPEFKCKTDNPPVLAIKSTRFHNLTSTILSNYQDIEYLGIVRNPCGAIHSWLSNPLEFPQGLNPLEEWRYGRCKKTSPGEFWGFDDWKKVTTQFLALEESTPARFTLIKYEELARNPMKMVESIFEKFSLPLGQQTIDFIKASQKTHNSHRRSVFKKPEVSNSWRSQILPEIKEEITTELRNTKLGIFLEE